MKLVLYTNYLNHHQVLIADELFSLLGCEFTFVTTLPISDKSLKGGLDYSRNRQYCLNAHAGVESMKKALNLAKEADVCMFGANSQMYAIERAKYAPNKLSFEIGERWLKHGWLTIGSPVFRTWIKNYYQYYRKANFYKLCASAFTYRDDCKLGAYCNRSYKWGYFTYVDENISVDAFSDVSRSDSVHTILWCARYLTWKHPELPVLLARRLKDKGYNFVIDMYGDECNAAKHDKVYSKAMLESLIRRLRVEDCVNLKGNRPNDEIIHAMREHEIFLFTSDRYEGWGAVANEAMSNGCVLVGSDEIGSIPYLVRDGENGLIFRSKNIESLYAKVTYLLDNPERRVAMAQRALLDMKAVWSPCNAVKRLLTLIDNLQNGCDGCVAVGPCSKAEII